MTDIIIKCPTCGKVFKLKEGVNINTASFTCPVCKEHHMVKDCPRQVRYPQPIAEEATQISGAPEQTKPGALTDSEGRTYPLSKGINTIGRKAASSTASVQITTDDRTMSRNHAVIEVHMTGRQAVHILRNGENKNPSYHKGALVGAADQLVLNDGDEVRFGATCLVFRCATD